MDLQNKDLIVKHRFVKKNKYYVKNKYIFVILFREEIYLGKIMCLHDRLILSGLSIRTLSKFL